MKNMKLLLPLLVLILLLVACGAAKNDTAVAPAENVAAPALADLEPEVSVQTVNEIQNRDDVYVIDVREQYEYDEKHIPGVTLLPMSEIESRLDEIPTDKTVIVTCRSGNRSGQVATFLKQNGYDNIHNMQGGIVAWEAAGLPIER